MAINRSIAVSALSLFAAEVLHDLDHLRQGRSIETPVIGLGIVAYLGVLAVLALAWRGNRFQSLAAVVVGFATALGFVLVHVLPDWGPFADGYPEAQVDAVSWAILTIDIAVALWLGAAGLRKKAAEPLDAPIQ